MRCIFCKQCSDNSRSVEHIIPESLGNIEHILPRGVVCDACNNYFSREVERPFLDSPFIAEARFRAALPSKRGNIPPVTGIHLQSLTAIQLFHSEDQPGYIVTPLRERDNAHWAKSITRADRGSLIIPSGEPANDRTSSRFIAKIGLEVLSQRLNKAEGGLDEVVDKLELEPLRRFARHGDNFSNWPMSVRRIYPPDFRFTDQSSQEDYEVMHEYMIHCTEGDEYHIVIAIFGAEYALNLGGPEIDGYMKWVHKNPNRSPLYPDRDLGSFTQR